MSGWPFRGLRRGHFGCIVADPPWRFELYSAKGEGKSPQRHYSTMTLAEIEALPVAQLAAPDCALFLWGTSPILPQALETLAAWGFKYKSVGAWAKRTRTDTAWQFGTGYLMRNAAEFFLLGTRGRPKCMVRNERNLIVAPVREHSRKPDQLRAKAMAMYGGPYLELFAREAAPGWARWGLEVDRFEPDRLAAD